MGLSSGERAESSIATQQQSHSLYDMHSRVKKNTLYITLYMNAVLTTIIVNCSLVTWYKPYITWINGLKCRKAAYVSGPGSVVGIAITLRDGRSGDRIPVWARFSALIQTGPGAHPASCTMGTGSFPGKKRPGRDADPSHLLVAWSWKGRVIPLLPL